MFDQECSLQEMLLYRGWPYADSFNEYGPQVDQNLWSTSGPKLMVHDFTNRFLAGDAVSLIQKPAMEIKTHIPDGKNAQIK